jgi:hypothetical protein
MRRRDEPIDAIAPRPYDSFVAGSDKLVARFEEHLLLPGEHVVAALLDNTSSIEAGNQGMGTRGKGHGDKRAQRLAAALGRDPEQRAPYYGLTLTDRRLVGWTFSLGADPTVTFAVPVPGPRLAYTEATSLGTTRVYAVIELGDAGFTTLAIQTKALGLAARDTKAAWDAMLVAFGANAVRHDQ